MTRLAGAHLVIPGGSEGIGLATARLAVARGARVSVLGRSRDKLAAAQREVDVATAPADVTDEPALHEALRALGPCDVLVACAGGAEPARLLEADTASLRRQVDLNLLGALHAVRGVLPAMRERGRGHVVLVSSTAALLGVYGYGAYGPAKAGLRNLAEVLRAEHPWLTVAVAYPPDTTTPGFARENETKPPETAAVSALVKPVSAEHVARAVVDGIERDRRTITADPGTALLARLPGLVAPVARASMRRAVRRSRR
jgi:3-dehydrosphinganine reductase